MSSTLSRRLQSLEQRQSPPDGPQVIRIAFLTPKDVPSTDEEIKLAYILGRGAGRPGCEVSRAEGETAAAFLARIEAERFRVHGPAT